MRLLALLLTALLALAAPGSSLLAQVLPGTSPKSAPATPAPDAYGRETPRSTVTSLLRALGDGDYARAAHFFVGVEDPVLEREVQAAGQATSQPQPAASSEPSANPSADTSASPAESPANDPATLTAAEQLARKLQIALDRGGTLAPFAVLSSDPAGQVDDGLAADLEQVGTLTRANNAPPILLVQVLSASGTPQWRIAPRTASAIDDLVQADEVAQAANDQGWMLAGAPLSDWLTLIGIAIGAFVVLRILSAALLAITRRAVGDHDNSPAYRFFEAALPPLSLYLAVLAFYFAAANLEVSIVARQALLRYAGIIAWVAVAWFALRLVDAVARIATGRMQRAERRQAISIITFLRRGAKVLLLAIATIAVLDTIGLDVTTGIAALGIGGLALALGAQKTIENLVGSVTIIADKPVQVGDFAQIGDVVGTIEDIGMRSTLVRTNNRTLVSIPNGDLAADRIENYAVRDRFLFDQTLGVTYDTDADAMEGLLQALRTILAEDKNIIDDGARVRFNGFGDSALQLEFFAYFQTDSFPESLAMQEALLLAIMRELERRSIGIAFPTRTVRLRADVEDT